MAISGDMMQHAARDTARVLPDVTSGRPFTPTLEVYKAGGKVFLIVTEEEDNQIITVKSDPDEARSLRSEHEPITEGRYLDKKHWISVSAGPGITAALVRELVEESHRLASPD